MSSVYLYEYFSKNTPWKNVTIFYMLMQNPILLTVAPGSENQKDTQRSCDQFPGSIASRWLF